MTDVDQVLDPMEQFTPENCRNPHPFYERLRRHSRVIRAPFGVQLVRRRDVESALAHPGLFSSKMDAVDLGNVRPLIPLQIDPPEHTTYRRLLNPLFSAKQLAPMEQPIAELVNGLIDGFIDRGACDFSAEFAVPLPTTVFLRLMGLPLEELEQFLVWKDGIIRPAGATVEEQADAKRAAAREIDGYFEAALDERARNRRDDMLTWLLDAEIQGERLTKDEILGICFLFLIAGLDTVTDALECSIAYLAQHPDDRKLIVEEPDAIPTAVEELLRWESPVSGVARVTTEDTEVGGCPIKAGEMVGISIGAANTDEDGCPGANTVDLRREGNRHLAFGGGHHLCLGIHLARMELRVAFREWHRRIPNYAIEDGVILEYTPAMRSIEHLPLVF